MEQRERRRRGALDVAKQQRNAMGAAKVTCLEVVFLMQQSRKAGGFVAAKQVIPVSADRNNEAIVEVEER